MIRRLPFSLTYRLRRPTGRWSAGTLRRQPHHAVLGVVVVLGVACQLDRGVDQERAEDVEDPGELVDRRGADRDEDAAEDQRQDDADQQRLLLVLPGTAKLRHDDQEDEQVVDRQAVFGQPAGEELEAELAAVAVPDPDTERAGQRDVHRQVERAFAGGRFMRSPADYRHVEDEHGDRHPDGDDPLQRRNIHGGSPVVDTWPQKTGRGLYRRVSATRGTGYPTLGNVMTTPRRRNTPLAVEYGRRARCRPTPMRQCAISTVSAAPSRSTFIPARRAMVATAAASLGSALVLASTRASRPLCALLKWLTTVRLPSGCSV